MDNSLKTVLNHFYILPFIGILSCVFIMDNNLVNGITTGKHIWFYIMIGLTSLTTIISYLTNQKNSKYSVVDFLLISFSILGITVTLLVEYAFTTKLILFILSVILYFQFRLFLFQYRSNFYLLVLFFILTGLIESIWGLRQLYGFIPSQHGLFNITGSFFNPGPYAGYLAVISPMALYYILRDWSITRFNLRKKNLPFYIRWFISLITLVATILILPATMSRASWIASAGGCSFVLVMYSIQQRYKVSYLINYFKNQKIKIITVSICSILLIALSISGIYHMKKDSAAGRAFIWKISMETIRQYPTGTGIGYFPGTYGKQQAEYFRSGQATPYEELIAGNPEYAFNEFIQICFEFGVVPFILLMIIFLCIIIIGIRKNRIGATASFISLLIFAAMSYPFNILPFVIVLTFLMALCISDFRPRYQLNKVSIVSLLVILSIIVSFCLKKQSPTYKAYKNWQTARMYYNTKAYKEANDLYRDLYPYLYDQAHYLFEYGQSLSKISKYEESNRILQKSEKISCDPMFYNIMGKNYQALQQYNHAEQCFLKAANIVPHRLYSYYLLSKLYIETGAIDKAKEIAELALNKPIKIDSPAVKEMRKEMKDIL